MIKKLRERKYVLYSRGKPRKRLGVFTSMKKAVKRERQINYFKHKDAGI